MSDEFYPLPQSLVRNLLDKIYEKRKSAAIDIEKLIKNYQSQDKNEEIRLIIRHCGENFCVSSNCHYRKGGTIGLAAVAIALGKQADKYCAEIIKPSIRLLQDPDSRVRYYACESLYNCIKVLEQNVMPFFQNIFDALSKGHEDPDKDVKSAILQLDKSLRETVTEADNLDVASIVTIIREKLYPLGTPTRMFIINWIQALDRITGVNMVMYLPEILDGLIVMLDDSDTFLVNKLKSMLNQFLNRLLEADGDDSYRHLVNILVFQISNERAGEIVRCTALLWLEKFIETFQHKILPFTSGILMSILPLFDEEVKHENIRKQAKTVSKLLIDLIKSSSIESWISKESLNSSTKVESTGDSDINNGVRLLPTVHSAVLEVPNSQLPGLSYLPDELRKVSNRQPFSYNNQINENLKPVPTEGLDLKETVFCLVKCANTYGKQTKLACLDWLHALTDVAADQTMLFVEEVFPLMFKFAVDLSSDVISSGLFLVAKFSNHDVMKFVDPAKSDFLDLPPELTPAMSVTKNQYFLRFLYDLVVYMDSNNKMLEEKGDLIIRELCFYLGAKLVYNTLAEIIKCSSKLENKFLLVHKFNRILLTNKVLYKFRAELRSIKTEEFCIIFKRLYYAWSYNKVALLSLVLLTQNYDHSRYIVKSFTESEIQVELMVELDLFITFIESPVYSFIRMHMMDPRYAHLLYETLYGVLMLLPQSDAFHILNNRLSCVPKLRECPNLIPYDAISPPDTKLIANHINFEELLVHLRNVTQSELAKIANNPKETTRQTFCQGSEKPN